MGFQKASASSKTISGVRTRLTPLAFRMLQNRRVNEFLAKIPPKCFNCGAKSLRNKGVNE